MGNNQQKASKNQSKYCGNNFPNYWLPPPPAPMPTVYYSPYIISYYSPVCTPVCQSPPPLLLPRSQSPAPVSQSPPASARSEHRNENRNEARHETNNSSSPKVRRTTHTTTTYTNKKASSAASTK